MTSVERIEWRLRHDAVAEESWRPETVAREIRARRATMARGDDAMPPRGSVERGGASTGRFLKRPTPIVRPRMRGLPSLAVLLLVLLAIVAGVVISSGLLPPAPVPTAAPSPSTNPTLARILASGQLRVAVVGPVDSIHGAVAQAVARGLGVTPALTQVPRDVIRVDGWNDRFDVAVGLVKGFAIGENQAFVGDYAYRPALMLLPTGSAITTPDQLAGHRVCARAAGDPLTWLTGFADADSATPMVALPSRDAMTIVTLPSDTECLAALDAGTVDAVFEDELTVTELQSPGHVAFADPIITERLVFMVTRLDPYAADLRFPIGDLLGRGLWDDGTLPQVFAQHPDENVQAIEPARSPAAT